jgi:hypothetical protein
VGRLLTWRLAENHQAELVARRAHRKVRRGERASADGRVSSVRPVDTSKRPSVVALSRVGPHIERRSREAYHRRLAARPRVAVGGGAPGEQQQLGAGRRQDEVGPPDSRQRSAPADRVPVRVVRDAPQGGGARRDWRDDSGRAVRDARSQRAHCVGHDRDQCGHAGPGD